MPLSIIRILSATLAVVFILAGLANPVLASDSLKMSETTPMLPSFFHPGKTTLERMQIALEKHEKYWLKKRICGQCW